MTDSQLKEFNNLGEEFEYAGETYFDGETVDYLGTNPISARYSIVELKLFINDLLAEQEVKHQRELKETITKCANLVSTHTEKEGGYCDTGEDMDWACRSKCVDLALVRLREYYKSII